MITAEWEGAMCDSPSCVSAVVGPNLGPEGVAAISSKKNPLCVVCSRARACAHVCVRVQLCAQVQHKEVQGTCDKSTSLFLVVTYF